MTWKQRFWIDQGAKMAFVIGIYVVIWLVWRWADTLDGLKP